MNKFQNKCNRNINTAKKMKIAHIFNHSYFLGGGEISFFELIRKLDKRIFEPIVIVPASGEIEKKIKSNNIEVHMISFPSLKRINNFSPVKSMVNLIRFLKTSKIDIIHVNGLRACFYSAIASRILRIPVIWHVRESITDMFIYDGFLASLANVIICVSKSVQNKRFRKYGKQINKKIFVIYNGVDTDKFKSDKNLRKITRVKYNVGDDEVFFGLIGNIIPRKAQKVFLEALSLAKKKKPNLSLKVSIVGRRLDQSYNQVLLDCIEKKKLNNIVKIEDFTSEITHLLSAIDVFVLTSKSEGFSRSLIEAMSMGLPVLATNLSEIKEALVENENGLLVNHSIEKISEAIIKLIENKNLRYKMREKNRMKVTKKFDLKTHTKIIESIYLKLMSKDIIDYN